jgi:hypothetical protein
MVRFLFAPPFSLKEFGSARGRLAILIKTSNKFDLKISYAWSAHIVAG